MELKGDAIAHITPLDKMTAIFKRKFSGSKGKQSPTHFEGAVPESLSIIIGGGPAQPVSLRTMPMKTTFEAEQ